MLPPGPVLDLAGGSGRNAVYLARAEHPVLLVDNNPDALAGVREEARAGGLAIQTERRDLEMGLPGEIGGFAGVVVSYYVQRSLLDRLEALLVRHGLVLVEGYGRREAVRRGRADSPYYWDDGELLSPPAGLRLLAGGEGAMRGRWRAWAVWVKR